MEMRIDEPRETLAVGQYDAPDAARRIGFVIRRLDQHFAAGKARIVVTELPLVGPVADIGLAVGLSAGIEGVFGRDGVTVAENDGTAVGDFGDLPVTGAVVEHFVTDAQRIEDHHQPRQGDQGERHPPHAHQVAECPGMTPGVGEERIEQSEHGDDHPLGLDVSAQRRKQKKDDKRRRNESQRAFDGVLRLHGDPRPDIERHEERVEDDQQVEQVFGDVTGPKDRVTPRQMIGQRRPVVLVLPHEMRHEQQQRHRAAEI